MSTRGPFHWKPSPARGLSGPVVSPSVPTTSAGAERHYVALDRHRGVASVAIVVFHVYQFCNVGHFLFFGGLGYTVLNSLDAAVSWLFVITAFLLFRPVARAVVQGSGRLPVRGFLLRRAIRVLPVYVVAVSVVWFVRQTHLPGDWRDLVEHLTFTQIFDEKRIFYTIGPAWSISVGAYFCVLIALLGVLLPGLCRRLVLRKQRIAALAVSVAVLSMVSLGWKAWAFSVGQRPSAEPFTTWFGPLANLDALAVGMAVAVLAETRRGAEPLGRRGLLFLRLAALTILISAFALRRADGWWGLYFLTACSVGLGCLVAAAVLGAPKDGPSRTPSSRLLVWLGAISLSLYLWHEPVLLALAALGLTRQSPDAFGSAVVVVLGVSVLVAWLSHSLIERPTSQLGRMFTRDGRLVRTAARARDDHVRLRSTS